jgi:hypothetical protein
MVSASSSTTFSNGLLSKKILKVSIEQLILCITKKRYREQKKSKNDDDSHILADSISYDLLFALFPGQ